MRRDRWLNLSMALAGGIIGGVLAVKFLPATPAAAQASKSLTAQAFYLVNPNGTRLADIQPALGGGATLTLYDHGGASLSLHATGGVSGVSLFDQHAKERLLVEVAHDGTPEIRFFGPTGKVSRQLR
jgi:hypothetical protein